MLCRLDSRTSQATPSDSGRAGGMEGSDIQTAKEFNLDVRKINIAKEVAKEVCPPERAVTPFSEYELRLGIAIVIRDGIEPRTAEQVRAWANRVANLKVGGDVLGGLKCRETPAPKTPEVHKLQGNMSGELPAAFGQGSRPIGVQDLLVGFNVLGYQQEATCRRTWTPLRPRPSARTSRCRSWHLVLHYKPRTRCCNYLRAFRGGAWHHQWHGGDKLKIGLTLATASFGPRRRFILCCCPGPRRTLWPTGSAWLRQYGRLTTRQRCTFPSRLGAPSTHLAVPRAPSFDLVSGDGASHTGPTAVGHA